MQLPEGERLSSNQYPAQPRRSGYRFIGWSSPAADKDGGLVVYAQWRTAEAISPPSGSNQGRPAGIKPQSPQNEEIQTPNLDKASGEYYLMCFAYGTIRHMVKITRGQAAEIFFQVMTQNCRETGGLQQSLFMDVPAGEGYHTAVAAGVKAGLLQGDGSGRFYPDRLVTRAEFTAMAVRFWKEAEGGPAPFADTGGHWAEREIAQAAAVGWVEGNRGFFRPDDPITRAEAAVIVNRMLGRRGEKPAAEAAVWPDNPPGTWYYWEMQWAAAWSGQRIGGAFSGQQE